jgi:hypothetical protein
LGVTPHSVRNWEKLYGQPSPVAPTALPFTPQTVPLPETGAPPEAEKEGGGYDAARAAAGLGPEPTPPPESEEPKKEGPKIPPEQALVFMSEMALKVSVRFYAARCKVKLDGELKALGELTAEERSQLETYAPFAAPFLSEMLLKYGAYIGAGIYGFIFWTMLTDRYAAIKEKAPKKEVPAEAVVK